MITFLRTAFLQSGAFRWSFVFFILMGVIGLPLLLEGSPHGYLVIAGWGGLWFIWSLVGYARRASWARDPVIPTRGVVPHQANQLAVPGERRITAQTEAVAFPDALRERLLAEIRRFKAASARVLLLLELVVLGVGATVSLVASQPLLLLAPAGIAIITAAAGLVLMEVIARQRERELGHARLVRTSGPMKLEWHATRFGRYWTIRIGDRTLHAWDEVGSRLANLPWCVATYTSSGRIIEVRTLDDTLDYVDVVTGPVQPLG
jgi:hypothetical protein